MGRLGTVEIGSVRFEMARTWLKENRPRVTAGVALPREENARLEADRRHRRELAVLRHWFGGAFGPPLVSRALTILSVRGSLYHGIRGSEV
jgi:hypothetical protein